MPSETPAPWWRRLIPYRFELVAVGGALLVMVFLRLQGMRMDWRTVDYILAPLVSFLPKGLLAGVGAYALWILARRQPLVSYLRQVATLGWMWLWLRLWLASMVFTYGYFWLKVTIPLVNPRLWDGALWQLDTMLHFGISPSIFAVEVLGDTVAVAALDLWYGSWIPTVFYSIAFFAAFPGDLDRRRFMMSCVLLWTLGSWLYLSLPALGPVYVFPEVWNELAGTMPRAEGGQLVLWDNYQKMLAGREGILRQFNPTRGIAALPSLHVGAHWLFALWARRRARGLFVAFAVATLLTFLGSLLTGWHYAIDGYVGMFLAWGCFRLALVLEQGEAEEEPDTGETKKAPESLPESEPEPGPGPNPDPAT